MFIWGLSSRPEPISVEGGVWAQREEGVEPEGSRVRSGWLTTCPDDISRLACVFLKLVGVKKKMVCMCD